MTHSPLYFKLNKNNVKGVNSVMLHCHSVVKMVVLSEDHKYSNSLVGSTVPIKWLYYLNQYTS